MRLTTAIVVLASLMLLTQTADAASRKKRRSRRNTSTTQVADPNVAADPATDANNSLKPQDANVAPPPTPRAKEASDPFAAPAEDAEPAKIESDRFVTLSLSVGNYSMAAFGLLGSVDFNRGFSADLGLGYSIRRGTRIGARARYHFLWHETFTPFLGLGIFVNPQSEPPGWNAGLFAAPIVGAVMRNGDGAFALMGIGYTFRFLGTRDYDDHGFAWEAAAGYTFY